MSESSMPESATVSENGNQAAHNGNPETSPQSSAAERETIKKLLAEARSTREVLMSFRSAIESGTFPGGRMMDIAKGFAFLDAVINQNQAHIANLQGRN